MKGSLELYFGKLCVWGGGRGEGGRDMKNKDGKMNVHADRSVTPAFFTGHRELQLAVPDTCQEYQFDEVSDVQIENNEAAWLLN